MMNDKIEKSIEVKCPRCGFMVPCSVIIRSEGDTSENFAWCPDDADFIKEEKHGCGNRFVVDATTEIHLKVSNIIGWSPCGEEPEEAPCHK